jgi:hypothetical protein
VKPIRKVVLHVLLNHHKITELSLHIWNTQIDVEIKELLQLMVKTPAAHANLFGNMAGIPASEGKLKNCCN